MNQANRKEKINLLKKGSGVLYPGLMTALIGPSGSGKTTLLGCALPAYLLSQPLLGLFSCMLHLLPLPIKRSQPTSFPPTESSTSPTKISFQEDRQVQQAKSTPRLIQPIHIASTHFSPLQSFKASILQSFLLTQAGFVVQMCWRAARRWEKRRGLSFMQGAQPHTSFCSDTLATSSNLVSFRSHSVSLLERSDFSLSCSILPSSFLLGGPKPPSKPSKG